MMKNRSIPSSTVIPVLLYPDVDKAVEWLSAAFGFTVRVRIGSHRVQMNVGDDGHMVVKEGRGAQAGEMLHSVMVRVEDVRRHHEQAVKSGARIVHPPEDYPYGERQYTAEDPGGHQWTFTQSISDVAPEEWGGQSGSI